jgi:hypothetical protein
MMILAVQENTGQGNDQIIPKVTKMKKFVEESIPTLFMEEKTGKFA